ncbi:MAG: exosortase C-terminal domain/associated protein EpsI [Pseudomonadota bacterium]
MMKRFIEKPLLRYILVAALMLASIGFLSYFSRSEAVPPRKPLSAFPKTIDIWTGQEGHFDKQVYDVLGVDDSALISYLGPGGKSVQLYIGYYHSQREGDLIHSPKNCMPGSGWDITRTSLEELNLPDKSHLKIKVIKLILEKGGSKQVVLYWFQSRGRFISSEYLQKIYMVWDAITKNRTDEAFVRLIAPVGPAGEDETTRYLKTFAEGLIPILIEFLPGENV